jgi:hypothetical protein
VGVQASRHRKNSVPAQTGCLFPAWLAAFEKDKAVEVRKEELVETIKSCRGGSRH